MQVKFNPGFELRSFYKRNYHRGRGKLHFAPGEIGKYKMQKNIIKGNNNTIK